MCEQPNEPKPKFEWRKQERSDGALPCKVVVVRLQMGVAKQVSAICGMRYWASRKEAATIMMVDKYAERFGLQTSMVNGEYSLYLFLCLRDGGGLEAHNLFVEELFQLFTADVVFVEIELKKFRVKWRRNGFIVGIVICLKVWVG